jgi:hypothetical protein
MLPSEAVGSTSKGQRWFRCDTCGISGYKDRQCDHYISLISPAAEPRERSNDLSELLLLSILFLLDDHLNGGTGS